MNTEKNKILISDGIGETAEKSSRSDFPLIISRLLIPMFQENIFLIYVGISGENKKNFDRVFANLLYFVQNGTKYPAWG